MQIRTALLALFATSALSTAAFAASSVDAHEVGRPASRAPQMAEQCMVLESQYTSVLDAHQSAPKLDSASELHSMGVTECNNNQGAIGVQHLAKSVKDLGVKPAV